MTMTVAETLTTTRTTTGNNTDDDDNDDDNNNNTAAINKSSSIANNGNGNGNASFQSDESSDGFRLLADDDGDSLMGSVVNNYDLVNNNTNTNNNNFHNNNSSNNNNNSNDFMSTDDEEEEFGGEDLSEEMMDDNIIMDEDTRMMNGGGRGEGEGEGGSNISTPNHHADAEASKAASAASATSTDGEEGGGGDKEYEELYNIGRQQVCCGKIFFVSIVVIVTIAVCIPIYRSSNQNSNYVIGIVVMACIILIAFCIYDCCCVKNRHDILVDEAYRSRKLVISLFPSNVHSRLFGGTTATATATATTNNNDNNDTIDVERPANNNNNNMVGEYNNNGQDDEIYNHQRHDAFESDSNNVMITNMATIQESGSGGGGDDAPAGGSVTGGGGGSASARSMGGKSISNSSRGSLGRIEPPMQRLRSFLSKDNNNNNNNNNNLRGQSEHGTSSSKQSHTIMTSMKDEDDSEPIADLFPDATVMFADISGFTAWSSSRDPTQVFKLLETIYRSFDKLAKIHKVFKVETIGDCYVAVTGLPDPQPDHAVIMSKFAKECMNRMNELTEELEISLGPGTSELCMRFGLHSGPVTAGVLRGSRSRFQLFGDTVNFASRMETLGVRNRIQASQATADLLLAAGKQNWVESREELVNAKGYGNIQTYWVTPRRAKSGSGRSLDSSNDDKDGLIKLKSKRRGLNLNRELSRSNRCNSRRDMMQQAPSRRSLLSVSQLSDDLNIWSSDKKMDMEPGGAYDVNRQERLIDWNVEVLLHLLRRIAAHREAQGIQESEERVDVTKYTGQHALEEIIEIIPLSDGGGKKSTGLMADIDIDQVGLHRKVEDQLREFVTMIACMYRDNSFHNFEHASHVLQSSQKLLKQVVKSDQERKSGDFLNNYTHVITTSPLTQFAIVFCSLIHDVDHTGVPNTQLVQEKAHIASLYNNKSIAEQNSLDLAWDLLMDRNYRNLQRAIFVDEAELQRFRQLVVNILLATDIFDPDHKALRNTRWEKAFGDGSLASPLSEQDDRSLKATVVIEYIMQASDVSHTMQHWNVYRRWNERLLEEMYSAYQVNRGDKDPSEGWYKGELWFFDNYVIPLAKKLKNCGVFGAASDECLNYAQKNRDIWEQKGESVVHEVMDRLNNKKSKGKRA